MLTKEENELLTRTGPGTPMGETMRRYWIPVLSSAELAEPDSPPQQVKLLGEQLVAFRDSNGRVGLLEEHCPHRGVSLWLGRNEECGLRCVYHGWKFDVEGDCVDQMNEPDSFAQKIRATAYPTLELGGIVWAYMGPRDRIPPPPRFEFTQVPESHRYVTRSWEECNWLQALEGGIDTSHVAVLHRMLSSNPDGTGFGTTTALVRAGPPTLELETTDYGYRYAGIRPLGDEGKYVRSYHFVMPFTQIRPQQLDWANDSYTPTIGGHFWVPMDDANCMVWNWIYSYGPEPLKKPEDDFRTAGNGLSDMDPANNFRKLRNKDIRWGIDRSAQRTENFTGITGVNTQDHAVQESMGPVVNRAKEHLGPADRAVIVARQLLMRAIQAVEDGAGPRGADTSYYGVRAIERVIPNDADWWTEFRA
ncbi:MAG TPA: Rieske 2Fe-2S domain-containing protein, partial [Dehalococcoidia bacterium]|nr:Rieske 2Fe-2S domain-containing protein [Dehalococcoidia bacterium]